MRALEKIEDIEIARMRVSFGVVCNGPLYEYAKLIDFVKGELPNTRLIFSLPSTRPLYLVKEGEKNERREREETARQSES
jgi:hypothetical protein